MNKTELVKAVQDFNDAFAANDIQGMQAANARIAEILNEPDPE